MDYQEAAEFARNTGSYVNFRDGEIPEIWKDIQEVVIKGGNREARSSSDQNDAAMASNDFDSQDYLESFKNRGPEPGARGMESLDLLSVPYMLVQAGVTELLMRAGMDGDEAWDDAGLAMLLYGFRSPRNTSGEIGILGGKAAGKNSRIDVNNLPKTVTTDMTEILAGRGTPIIKNGGQAITQNRSGISPKWVGAKEWKITDVPGTGINGSRVLQHPNGNWGLVTNHDYTKIIQIPTSSVVK